jgi:hypothetical protein
MGKLRSLLLVGTFLAGSLINAQAVVVNYAVDPSGGTSFGTPLTVPAGGGMSDLIIVPSVGLVDCGASLIEFDVASLFLDTDRAIASAVTDTIVVDTTVRIRLDADDAGPLLPTDWFQDVEFTITGIKQGSAITTLTKNLFDDAFASQTKFLDGVGDVTLIVGTFDDVGAPQLDPFATRTYRGTGALTDQVVCVPEPGAIALLAGGLITGPLLLRRRRRR